MSESSQAHGAPAFSSSSTAVIEKGVEDPRDPYESPLTRNEGSSLEWVYEIDETARKIDEGGYRRICLQFPDSLLPDSVPIFRHLRRRLAPEKELWILADTTFGSCCVDEVAAQHVDADLVVHYGHACLSPTSRLSVIYVFLKHQLDVRRASEAFRTVFPRDSPPDTGPKAAILMYDVAYAWKAVELHSQLKTVLPLRVILSKTQQQSQATRVPSHATPSTRTQGCSSCSCSTTTANCTNDSTNCCQHSPASNPDAVSCCQSGPSREPQGNPPAQRVTEDADDCPPDGISESIDHAPVPAGFVPSQQTPGFLEGSNLSGCRRYSLPDGIRIEDCVILYVGRESLALTNILMTHPKTAVWSFDPSADADTEQPRLESAKTNKMLMRRYAVIQKAKDSDVVGIVVGTLGVASYLPLIDHLRELLKKAQKKSYIVIVGKLNPAKLANYQDVECWVLVACGENSIIDTKDFFRPIVTPYELELALDPDNSWTGDYILDFDAVLASSSLGNTGTATNGNGGEQEERDTDAPVFSLVTGTYRNPVRYGQATQAKDLDDIEAQAGALQLRNQEQAVAQVLDSAAGSFLSKRSYKGLEPRYGLDAPTAVVEGRTGIARGYGDDHPSPGS